MSDEDGMVEAADYYKRALDVAVAENERLKRERDDAREKFVGTVQEIQRLDATLEGERAERDRYRTALETIGQRSLTFKHLGEPHCDTCLRLMKDCDGAVAADRCPGRIARRALTSTTPPTGAERDCIRCKDLPARVCLTCYSRGVHDARKEADAEPAAAPPVVLRPEPVNLLARLMKFTEHVSDVLNEMDAVEDEDLEVEGGILAEVRAFLAAAQPRGEK